MKVRFDRRGIVVRFVRLKRHLAAAARVGLAALALTVSACDGSNIQLPGFDTAQSGTTAPGPLSDAEAARFLTQATFGPTQASIKTIRSTGYASWIDQQMAMPTPSHVTYVDNRLIDMRESNATATLAPSQFYESFWNYSSRSDDQLRQRVKFALSEIFVISLLDPNIDTRGAASYYDMLGANAFGNFRTLLEQVSLHPMMGVYLTSIANQKEDAATGRNPDENYAREVLQLMSIGVSQLNADGTARLDSAGAPIPAYTSADIAGLAKVFTGWSWYHPTPTANTFAGRVKNADAAIRPMIFYSAFHSTSEKAFLGRTIASGSTDGPGDLKIALDTIFAHPNVGPFVSKQLIQRLVTSNPSPAYVARVVTVFNNNGAGVRGDMAAVIRAILLDPEARHPDNVDSAVFGKVREPIIRMTNWMRAFNATSVSGAYLITSTSANTSLGQSPLSSPSVFNFYRPGYSPPNTRLGAVNLLQPEFQIVDEVSVAGYANTMQNTIGNGIGTGTDVRSTYAAEMMVAGDPLLLVDRINTLLLYGQMSGGLRARILDAVRGITVPGGTATQAQINTALTNRAKLAIYLTMISPEYLVQR